MISCDLVKILVPEIVDVNFLKKWHFSQTKYQEIKIEFNDEIYINKDILNYLFDVYLTNNSSKFIISNLIVNKMSMSHLCQTIRDYDIELNLSILYYSVHAFEFNNKGEVEDLISFIEVFLEKYKWTSNDELNQALKTIFERVNFYDGDSSMWKSIIELFISYGYDPLSHDLNVLDLLHQPGLFECLSEFMDPNKLANNIILGESNIEDNKFFKLHGYLKMRDYFKILANKGVDINSILCSDQS